MKEDYYIKKLNKIASSKPALASMSNLKAIKQHDNILKHKKRKFSLEAAAATATAATANNRNTDENLSLNSTEFDDNNNNNYNDEDEEDEEASSDYLLNNKTETDSVQSDEHENLLNANSRRKQHKPIRYIITSFFFHFLN